MSGPAAAAANRKTPGRGREAGRPGGRAPRVRGQAFLAPALGRSGEIRNNDCRLREEDPSATLSLLLGGLPAPRAGPLETVWKAALVPTATHRHLKKVNLANDMQVLQDRVIAENLQRTPSADVLNTSGYRN